MNRILLSQRVDVIESYEERRDALDQRWAEFLWKSGCIALPVLNHDLMLAEILKAVPIDGILLTGGNTPAAYGGSAHERDTTDEHLISHALKNNIPLLGVCRGMQSIVMYFGGTLCKAEGHVAVRHDIDSNRNVNSYHEFAPELLPDELLAIAYSADGVIEHIKHKKLPLMGIMWHPERDAHFAAEDIELIRKLFGD